MRSIVLLLSGGMDSTVCLWDLVSHGANVRTLTVLNNHRWTNRHETSRALRFANELQIPHSVVDLTNIGSSVDEQEGFKLAIGGQIGRCIPAPPPPRPRIMPLPFSVTLMLQTAMMHAAVHDSDKVVWALHKDDLEGEPPDATLRFLDLLGKLAECEQIDCRIVVPYIERTKTEIAAIGLSLGAPIDETFSCSADAGVEGIACGACAQCVKRSTAFAQLRKLRLQAA